MGRDGSDVFSSATASFTSIEISFGGSMLDTGLGQEGSNSAIFSYSKKVVAIRNAKNAQVIFPAPLRRRLS